MCPGHACIVEREDVRRDDARTARAIRARIEVALVVEDENEWRKRRSGYGNPERPRAVATHEPDERAAEDQDVGEPNCDVVAEEGTGNRRGARAGLLAKHEGERD